MAVRRIGRSEFNRLVPYTGELTPFIGEGAEWFADDARGVIGVVARSATQPVWRYAVLKRSALGGFRVSSLGDPLPDLLTAQDECQRAIAAANLEPTVDAAAVPQPATVEDFERKPRGNLFLLVLILIADVITIGAVSVLLFHWW